MLECMKLPWRSSARPIPWLKITVFAIVILDSVSSKNLGPVMLLKIMLSPCCNYASDAWHCGYAWIT